MKLYNGKFFDILINGVIFLIIALTLELYLN